MAFSYIDKKIAINMQAALSGSDTLYTRSDAAFCQLQPIQFKRSFEQSLKFFTKGGCILPEGSL
jgi:hypothetical protein